MKEKNFLTLFLRSKEIHLKKDVGVIPKKVAELDGFYSTLVTKNEFKSQYFKVDCVKEVKFIGVDVTDFIYLLKNSGKITVLNLYHDVVRTWVLAGFYKALNPSGKVYIKTDNDLDNLVKISESGNAFKKAIKNILCYIFSFSVELLSTESSLGIEYYRKNRKFLLDKIVTIRNSVEVDLQRGIDFTRKENLIVTVGRIGTHQKNTELLLSILSEVELLKKGWRVLLVGTIEKEFEKEIDTFFYDNPDLKDCITFTGPIYNVRELQSIYEAARIFVLTSRYEGLPHVFFESRYFGCEFISTTLSGFHDYRTDEGVYLCNSREAFNDRLVRCMDKPLDIEKVYSIHNSQLSNSWEHNIFPLLEWLKNVT